MRRLLIMMLVMIFSLALFGCGDSKEISITNTEPQQQTQNKKTETSKAYTIGLVMKTLTNPFFIEMEKGARKAESETGIKLIVKTGAKETSIDQQIKIIEDMTKDNVDAIVIAPGSSTEVIPALKKAQDAGIKIVNIDNKLDAELSKEQGLKAVPFISVDNEAAAYLSAKQISDLVKTPSEAVILEGIRGTDNGEQRKNGALRAFKENRNIKLVASESANWKIDEANSLIKRLYEKYPHLNVIFCANDMMALGVVQYIKETGKKGMLIAGFDNLEEARTAIKNKEMKVTIDQRASEQGYTGVLYAIRLLKGEEVPLKTMVDVEVVNEVNIR